MRADFLVAPSQPETIAPNGFGTRPIFNEQEDTVNITAGIETLDSSYGRSLQIEDLYPIELGRAQLLATARSLLAMADERLTRAQEYIKDGNVVGADYEISLFQGDIPELFCCGVISEGLAAITVAVHHALQNRGPSPITVGQLNEI
jgi:hypothetical protein